MCFFSQLFSNKVRENTRLFLFLLAVSLLLNVSVFSKSYADELPSAVSSTMEKINSSNTKMERTRKGAIIAADHVPKEILEAVERLSDGITHIGRKENNPLVWPLYWEKELVGWAFDTGDFIKIPGFSGGPIESLVILDPDGDFVGVRVLRQNEPVFQHGVGPPRMHAFAEQYAGHSIRQNIKVRIRSSDGEEGAANTFIDGITMATASVMVLNDSVILAAMKVASEKLEGFSYQEPAKVRYDKFEKKSWDELVDEGLIKHQRLSYQELAGIFSDTNIEVFEGVDGNSSDNKKPGDTFIDFYFCHLNIPTLGKNILGEKEYKRLINDEIKPGENVILIAANGPYSFLGEEFVQGSVPDRLSLVQNNLALEMRDLGFYRFFDKDISHLPPFQEFKLFTIKKDSIFNPAQTWTLKLLVQKSKGFLSGVTTRSFDIENTTPSDYFQVMQQSTEREAIWKQIWKSRAIDIIILLISLLIVTALFLYQRKVVESTPRLRWIRWIFLFYTFGFIGWYAQGQLSVINIFPIIEGFKNGFSLSTFLIDPMTFILWLFVFTSLFLWGRGLFCGWLCPFGALQEMIGWVAEKLQIKQWKISEQRHQQLWMVKYIILIGLVGVAIFSSNQAIQLSEIEPFKTTITERFVRHWPFVLYAIVILGLGLFVHKFYCRYVCPLGAGLAILGYFHRFKWLDRRKECGSPCQLCHHVCKIRAIEKTGEINYNECIQCLDCVAVLKADDRCAIRIVEVRNEKKARS